MRIFSQVTNFIISRYVQISDCYFYFINRVSRVLGGAGGYIAQDV